MKKDKLTNRIKYLDYLRIAAAIGVMVLHVAGQNWTTVDIHTGTWQVFNLIDSWTRWSVPIFIMISGILFLDKDLTIKKIYSKYVLRLMVAFGFWSVLYAFLGKDNGQTRVKRIIQGHYHMWFILMLVGLYVCLPFLKMIAQDQKICSYFLILSFICTFLVPQAKMISTDFAPHIIKALADDADLFLNNFMLHFVFGCSFFFLLGYKLSKENLTRKMRVICYSIGFAGFILTPLLTHIRSQQLGYGYLLYYSNYTINVLMESIGVFVLFKTLFAKSSNTLDAGSFEKSNLLVATLADWSFGTYLVHALVLEQIDAILGINTLTFNPVLAILLISFMVFIISYAISGVLHQIPIVKKYLV